MSLSSPYHSHNFAINVRLVGVGFRATVLKVNLDPSCFDSLGQTSKDQLDIGTDLSVKTPDPSSGYGLSRFPFSGRQALRFVRGTPSEPYIKVLNLKVGKSALTLYPIPSKIEIYCPTDQQQQADNQPFLVTSDDWQELTSVVAEIKSYKKEDPYKGSGIHICDRIETETGEIYPIRSKHSRPLKEIKK